MALIHLVATPAAPGFVAGLQDFVSAPVVWVLVVGVLVFVIVVGVLTCFGWVRDAAQTLHSRFTGRSDRHRHLSHPRHAEHTGLLIRS